MTLAFGPRYSPDSIPRYISCMESSRQEFLSSMYRDIDYVVSLTVGDRSGGRLFCTVEKTTECPLSTFFTDQTMRLKFERDGKVVDVCTVVVTYYPKLHYRITA